MSRSLSSSIASVKARASRSPASIPKQQPFKPRSIPNASLRAPPPSASRIKRLRRPALFGLAAVVFTGASYPVYTYLTFRREAEALKSNPPPPDTSYLYQSCANTFDDSVSHLEWFLGIGNLRSVLLSQARGHVLEVAVGTGRNASYYPLTRGIKSITMVDSSSEMIRVARMSWAKTNAFFINAAFRIQSAKDAVPYPHVVQQAQAASGEDPSHGGYDTVVQTMGICSTGDPVAVLRNMGQMCRPDGKILLLEHGRAKYRWVNRILDEIAPAHAARWGCWFNKDVDAIVRASGLEVVEQKRYHFGTTFYYVLKPPANRKLLENPASREKPDDSTLDALQDVTRKQSTWMKWWREAD